MFASVTFDVPSPSFRALYRVRDLRYAVHFAITSPPTGDKANSREIYSRCDELYELLQSGGQLGKQGDRRTEVLGTLFALLTCGQADSLLKMSRIILAVGSRSRSSLWQH